MPRVLVVDDQLSNVLLFKATLKHGGYQVEVAMNGKEALATLARQQFDAVVTDWMMPEVDGMDLVRNIRRSVRPHPVVIMVTASTDPAGRDAAFSAGADDYILKPVEPKSLLQQLQIGFARQNQKMPTLPPVPITPPPQQAIRPGQLVAVGIGASTGGPPALEKLFQSIAPTKLAAFYVVQHGPAWMFPGYVKTLQQHTAMSVALAYTGQASEPGRVYLCPGDFHMTVDPARLTLKLLDTPQENFVKPAIDPLFRGLANAFGARSIGVVLTGMGHDGVLGCAEIERQAGTIFVQDPVTAVIPSMPNAIIQSGIRHTVLPIPEIGLALDRIIARQAAARTS